MGKAKRRVRIEELRIRVRGGDASTGRAIGAEIARDVLTALARQRLDSQRDLRIDNVDVRGSAEQIGERTARAIAETGTDGKGGETS